MWVCVSYFAAHIHQSLQWMGIGQAVCAEGLCSHTFFLICPEGNTQSWDMP